MILSVNIIHIQGQSHFMNTELKSYVVAAESYPKQILLSAK